MGCGQSKINIYPRRSKNKNNNKKAAVEKAEGEEDEGGENEQDPNSNSEDADHKKKQTKKSMGHVGGPLLVQAELSSSQQNFFRMLDEKIENGPDYDSGDETEMALESARLHTLLKDWETASSSSRSLPNTPKHQARRLPPYSQQLSYRHQTNYNPAYQHHSPTHQQLHYIPNMHYQEHQYAAAYQKHYGHPNAIVGSPVHSPKHKYYPHGSPHKVYVPTQAYTNGELIIHQQLYNQQVQYQQNKEYQQYKLAREQMFMQQSMGVGVAYVPRQYQSSVSVPVVGSQSEASVQHVRKQRHYEPELT